MKHRLLWVHFVAGAALLFYLAAIGESQNTSPTPALAPVPFHSSDGHLKGWRIAIPGNRPLASPAIGEGKVFVGGGFGSHEFYAFDAATGRRLWTYQTADDGPTAAVVHNGIIAFNTESCELEILTTGGRRLWKKWLGDPLMSMPAISNGRVYMAYPDSRGKGGYYVSAFDIQTGETIWKYSLPTDIITAPIIDRGRLYAATVDGSILALNENDGSKIWQESKNATSAPAVWNEQCFYSRREETKVQEKGRQAVQQNEVVVARKIAPLSGTVALSDTRQRADYLDYSKNARSIKQFKSQSLDASVGFAASKGAVLMAPAMANLGQASVHGIWSYQGSKPFIHNGRLYSSMGDTTRSVDPRTGKVIWSRTQRDATKPAAGDDVLTPPVIVNGKIFVGTAGGELYALSEQTGEVLWKVELGEPISFQPTVANGRIYVGTDRGSLFCLSTGNLSDDGWLMWGANAGHNGSDALIQHQRTGTHGER
jgi:Ca-activated chloride channel family protein